MPQPIVVFIYGPVASGKLTIAKELSRLTGLRLFHNHLTVDLLLALFPFGHPSFVRLREKIWSDSVREAVSAGISSVFTFAPERTVTPSFPNVFAEAVRFAGGQIAFVEIRCPEAEIERRLNSASRSEHGKLVSIHRYRELRAQGAFDYPPIHADLLVDSFSNRPLEAARKIADALRLPDANQA